MALFFCLGYYPRPGPSLILPLCAVLCSLVCEEMRRGLRSGPGTGAEAGGTAVSLYAENTHPRAVFQGGLESLWALTAGHRSKGGRSRCWEGGLRVPSPDTLSLSAVLCWGLGLEGKCLTLHRTASEVHRPTNRPQPFRAIGAMTGGAVGALGALRRGRGDCP